MKKNEEYVGIISDVGVNGEGIVRQNGIVVFVPFSYIGEKIKYKILKVEKTCAYGKLLEIIEKSPERVEPICSVFGKCGGCAVQHIDYNAQLKFKKSIVKNAFSKIANVDFPVNDTIKSDKTLRYRNKLQLPVAFDGEKNLIGFYASNSHRVIPIDDCPINPEWTADIIYCFNKYLSEYNLKGFSPSEKYDIREITVREVDGNLIITAVFPDKKHRYENKLIEILDKNLKYNYSLYFNYNDGTSNVIYGKDFKLAKGEGVYGSELLGVKFNMGVLSFMQVNLNVCEKLYSAAIDYATEEKNSVVIDAYSGAGLLTAMLAKKAKFVYGIEIVNEAVDLANVLAVQNNLSEKIRNYLGKCEDILPDIISAEKKKGNKISVVLDPPRKGCDYKVINALIEFGADRIIYISCLPSTLARDVGLLVGTLNYNDSGITKGDGNGKYKIESITPFDMFPQTKHVETLVVLSRI